MITDIKYIFTDETNEPYRGRITRSILFSQDGSVDMLRNITGGRAEDPEKFSSQAEFAVAHPVQAANVMKFMRTHGRDIKEIQFPEKVDLVPVTKKCVRCGMTKSITQFPPDDTSKDGTHNECCTCRIEECKGKKFYCTAISDQWNAEKVHECMRCPVRQPVKKG